MQAFANKEWEWDADSFSALLLNNTYTFDQDADVFVTDLTGELSGGSYARVALSTKTIDSTSTGLVKLKCDPIVFSSLTASNVQFMVVFRNTGSDATSKLFCCTQFDATIDPSSQPVTCNVNTNGLVNMTA